MKIAAWKSVSVTGERTCVCQYLYFCTSKASKLRTGVREFVAVVDKDGLEWQSLTSTRTCAAAGVVKNK